MDIDTRLTYTVQEVADLLGISRNLAYESVQAGIIPSIRFGRRILIPRLALEKKLTEAAQGSSKLDAAGKPGKGKSNG